MKIKVKGQRNGVYYMLTVN